MTLRYSQPEYWQPYTGAVLHGKLQAKKAMCEGKIHPTLPKQQYKFTSVYPRPETKSAHVMGESTMKWGLARKVPAVGEDLVYMIWRWNDCCNY